MSDLLFACETCNVYIDAGESWAYWTLEDPGIVQRDRPVDLGAVLDAREYWRGGEEAAWLAEQLPRVRCFLDQHREHSLVFVEDDSFLGPKDGNDFRFLEWASEMPRVGFDISLPRLVSGRQARTWAEVEAYVDSLEQKPWWWNEPTIMPTARKKFDQLVRECDAGHASLPQEPTNG